MKNNYLKVGLIGLMGLVVVKIITNKIKVTNGMLDAYKEDNLKYQDKEEKEKEEELNEDEEDSLNVEIDDEDINIDEAK